MIEIASAHGLIKKSGSWLEWTNCPTGPLKMLGVEKFRKHFVENEAHRTALYDRVMPLLGGGKSLEGFVTADPDDDEVIVPGLTEEPEEDGPDDGPDEDLEV
jgi:hypothetical protein